MKLRTLVGIIGILSVFGCVQNKQKENHITFTPGPVFIISDELSQGASLNRYVVETSEGCNVINVYHNQGTFRQGDSIQQLYGIGGESKYVVLGKSARTKFRCKKDANTDNQIIDTIDNATYEVVPGAVEFNTVQTHDPYNPGQLTTKSYKKPDVLVKKKVKDNINEKGFNIDEEIKKANEEAKLRKKREKEQLEEIIRTQEQRYAKEHPYVPDSNYRSESAMESHRIQMQTQQNLRPTPYSH